MKKRSSSRDAFFKMKVAFGIMLFSVGVCLALASFASFSKVSAQTGGGKSSASGSPEIVRMVGPVSVDQDLRDLPYVAPKAEFEEKVLTRHPHPEIGQPAQKCPDLTATLLKKVWQPTPTMPPPLLTFKGVAET